MFKGERLYLREMNKGDATLKYCSWLSDAEVTKYLATKGSTIEDLQSYILEKNKREDVSLFGIFMNDDDNHIGTIKLEFKDSNKVIDIAMMIGDKNYWGKGLIQEAMKLLIDYCFNVLGNKTISLGVVRQNKSAVKAYKKVGFSVVEIIENYVKYPNGTFDQVFMELKNNN